MANLNEPNVLRAYKVRGGWRIWAVYLGGLLASMSVSTQHFAKLFNYVVQLGPNIDHWYAPWDILIWWHKYSAYYPNAFKESMFFGFIGMIVLTIGLMIWLRLFGARPTATESLHDSGRWATFKDLRTAGLLPSFDLTWFEEALRDVPDAIRLALFSAVGLGLMVVWVIEAGRHARVRPAILIGVIVLLAIGTFVMYEVENRRITQRTEPDGVWVGGLLDKRWQLVWLGESVTGKLRKALTKRGSKLARFIPRGVPFLAHKQEVRILRHSGPEHIAAFAPTRSGKGVGLIIGTLLTWKHSMICTDIKGELWELTSGWRREEAGNLCLRFEPSRPSETLPDGTRATARWNPLDEVRIRPCFTRTVVGHPHCEQGGKWSDDEGELEIRRDSDGFIEWNDALGVSDAQNLAMLVVDPLGKGLEDHWAKTSYAIMVGWILHVIYMWQSGRSDYPPSLRRIDQIISDPNLRLKDLWSEMILGGSNPAQGIAGYYRSDHAMVDPREKEEAEAARKQAQKLGKPAQSKPMTAHKGSGHPAAVSAAQDMVDRPENEGGSVISTAKSFLSLYREPIVGENTSYSDFRIRDLMHAEKPVSLYVILPPSNKDKMMPLVRIMLNACMRNLVEGKPRLRPSDPVTYKHRLLCMFDEFPSIGKLPIIQEGLAYVAGYGIKCYIIAQDREQILDETRGYGRNESITSNCHIQVAYAPLKIETAKYLSEKCGEYTVIEAKRTTSGGGRTEGRSASDSLNETKRALLTPYEVMTMPGPEKDRRGMITKPGRMIVTVAGMPSVYGTQSLFFLYPEILRRNNMPALTFSDVVIPGVVSPTERKYRPEELAAWTTDLPPGADLAPAAPEPERITADLVKAALKAEVEDTDAEPEEDEPDEEEEEDPDSDEPGEHEAAPDMSDSESDDGPPPDHPAVPPAEGATGTAESDDGESDGGARGSHSDRVIVVETVSTGGSPEDGDRLVEVGCVEVRDRRRTNRVFHEHLNPERKLEPEVAEQLRLTDEELSDCPTFAEVAEELRAFIEGASLVGHNVTHDLKMIDAELRRAGLPPLEGDRRRRIVDTLLLAQSRDHGKRVTVEELCKQYGVEFAQGDGKRNALRDAERLADLYLAMSAAMDSGGAGRAPGGEGDRVAKVATRSPEEGMPQSAELSESVGSEQAPEAPASATPAGEDDHTVRSEDAGVPSGS